jgi:hypothetical protein
VKGGGHSDQGISSAPDSLLIWARAMNRIQTFPPRNSTEARAASMDGGGMRLSVIEKPLDMKCTPNSRNRLQRTSPLRRR